MFGDNAYKSNKHREETLSSFYIIQNKILKLNRQTKKLQKYFMTQKPAKFYMINVKSEKYSWAVFVFCTI